jgi:hypothetical protein
MRHVRGEYIPTRRDARSVGLGGDQLEVERDRDPARDLVLQGEQIRHVAVEPLGPQMLVGCGIDKLCVDANLVARPANAPFQHIAHTKLAADLLRVDKRRCDLGAALDATIPTAVLQECGGDQDQALPTAPKSDVLLGSLA